MRQHFFALQFAWITSSFLIGPSGVYGSSFEVIVGRYYLTQSNLPYAQVSFANATDAEGKVLKALTSLALLQRETNAVSLVSAFHYVSPANIWQAQSAGYPKHPSTPTPYRTATGTRGAQVVSLLRNVHLPAFTQAENDLANFTDNSQLIPLGRSETGNPDINLDRGDILMIRSLLACGRFLAYFANSQNIDVIINDYILLEEEPGPVTIEKILSRFPDLAKLATASDLPVARNEAKNAIALYKQASDYIRSSRPLGVVRLFNLPGSFGVKTGEIYTAALADEAKFRAKLDEYAALMDGPALMTGFDNGAIDTFNGKPLFDGLLNLRSILPNFRKNKIRQGDVTESFAKAGGVYPGNTVSRTEDWLLSETLTCAYDPFAYGLFVPPSLTISSIPQGPLLEGNNPQDLFFALGWLWGGAGDRYSDSFGLYSFNPTSMEFSKLTTPPITDNGWVRAVHVSDGYLLMMTQDWSTYPSQHKINQVRLSDGYSPQSLSIPLNNFDLHKALFSDTDLILWGYFNQMPFGYGFYKINIMSRAVSQFFVGTSYQSLITLNATKTHILAHKTTYDPPAYIAASVIDKIDISNGQVVESIPINSTSPNWNEMISGGNNMVYAFGSDWSSWPATMTLSSLNLTNGEVSLLNSNVLPSGRQRQGIPALDASGNFALVQSTDLNWQGAIMHKVRLSDGVVTQSTQIGKAGDEFWFEHLWPATGALLFGIRSGDISEEISVAISLTGEAQIGLDYLWSESLPLIFRAGNLEQPISFTLINDSTTEFNKTITFSGTPDSLSEASFQGIVLTIVDDDGVGVGIFATDNQGKEGRLDPDPFGFRYGIYNPIRFEVRRTGSTTNALAVKVGRDLLLSSATPDDYQITGFDVDGQTVRIPAGQSSTQIVVSPKYDLEYPEGTESLVLQISPDPSYALTTESSASASILDSSLYEWWSYQSGLLVANHPPGLDIDGDGMPNGLEMALGRDPNLSDSPNHIQQGQDPDGYLTLTFKRWSGGVSLANGTYRHFGVTYEPQATSDLESPTSWTNSTIEVRSISDTGDGMELVTVRDTLSKSQPARFLRLKTTLSE